ncbi:MAG: hypothetical protein ACON34_10295 [Flavobacteriales bacterium]
MRKSSRIIRRDRMNRNKRV